MATPPPTSTGALIDLGVNDLGPLAWVLDELRKSLDSANKALRRYVRDAELAKGSDLNAADASQLRIARQQLHQSVGALEMVGFAAPASMLRGMEVVIQKFISQPALCTDTATVTLERASFAILGYLEALLLGKSPSSVELFSQYAEIQELAGATRVHPADLWVFPWRWRDVQDVGAPILELDANFRSRFDKSALMVVKAADAAACGDLAGLCAGLANQTLLPAEANFRIFWRLASAFFESLHLGALGTDVYVKRTVSRLLIQLATHIKGDLSVPDRLAQDLVFFCAQSVPKNNMPKLGEVRLVFGLAQYVPVDYTKSFYGHFDPSILVQARKRIGQLKESWSFFTAGELSKAKSVQDQMSLLIDSISKLLPLTGQAISSALNEVVDSTARVQRPPEPALAMEVATAILYVEASLEDFDPDDALQSQRMSHLAKRVQDVRLGSPSQPLESWMEELYRRVSDRQTMGSVVGELKLTLGELERLMDAYFRDPQDKVLLADVPSKLTQMRGVLTVLGLDQASQAVIRMREQVEQILLNNTDDLGTGSLGIFENLGSNLGALGFLIDMLSYQPVLAKKLFIYDEQAGELRLLMGRTVVEDTPVVRSASSPAGFDPIATVANFTTQHNLSTAPIQSESHVETVPAAPVIVNSETVDPELLEIFLEEAREVATTGLEATRALTTEPNNLGEMTTLRRSYHTLKGSSRMVGLHVFGEAAWSMEQVLNSWLADQKLASADLCSLSTQALQALQAWIEEIAVGGGKNRSSEPFRISADALRTEGRLVTIAVDSSQQHEQLAPTTPDVSIAANSVITVSSPDPTTPPASSLDSELPGQPSDVINLDLVFPQIPESATDYLAPEVNGSSEIEWPDSFAQEKTTTEPPALSNVENFSLQLNDLGEPYSLEATKVTPGDAVIDLDFEPANTSESSPVFTSDTSSTVDWSPPQEESSESASMELSPADEANAPTTELITAEELAAFELAMMEMSVSSELPAPGQAETVPFSEAIPIASPPLALDSGDLEALESISALLPEPSSFKSSDTVQMTLVAPAATLLQQFDKDFNLDFDSRNTEPAPLSAPISKASSQGLASDLIQDVNAYRSDEPPVAPREAIVVSVAATEAPLVAAIQTPNLADSPSAASITPLQSADEQVKAIGSLRVSLPLYNVYLNEADEWSRRLSTLLAEWALEPHAKLPHDCAVFAHSLAGSSATVGFVSLSSIARNLEHALMHMQRVEEDSGYNPHAHDRLFIDAAEEIRHLLHQFAAGILKDSSSQIEAQLLECQQVTFTSSQSALLDVLTTTESSGFIHLQDTPAPEYDAPVEDSHDAAPELVSVKPPETSNTSSSPVSHEGNGSLHLVSSEPAPSDAEHLAVAQDKTARETSPSPDFAAGAVATTALTATSVLAVRSRQVDQDEINAEIDLQDALDPDLFEIFEEEALEIFPATSSALRQWSARPDNSSARSEVLRGLHTLKGSARLAGALRLGEMAHRMESSVEAISQDNALPADIEPLMAMLDGMQRTLEMLRRPQFIEPAPARESVLPNAPAVSAQASSLGLTASNLQPTASNPVATTAKAVSGSVSAPWLRASTGQTVRVRAQLLDRMMNQTGEVMITRSRLEAELSQLRGSLSDLNVNLEKMRQQLRELDVQAESQMQSRIAQAKETEEAFDPLEFDRYTRVQELTRMMAESVNDVATVQRNIQRTIESTEDDLIAQARQTRELQRDLLRTRMVEFEGISERLYRVVRQAGKDTGKQVKLDILGGTIEMDRGVLDRMTPAFEHLLRNCVAHGIESVEERTAAGKSASGEIVITLHQEGNDVSIEFRDDGAGLNVARIREKAIAQGLLGSDAALPDSEAANLIFTPGFTTATQVTELSGRGVGMDVVRSEVVALGGRIDTTTTAGNGTSFKLVLPLTTAVTQVVMVRVGDLALGIPANLIEIVRRVTQKELQQAYNAGSYDYAQETVPFYWAGALLQYSAASTAPTAKTLPVMVFRSASQRVALHIDEVLGNQEVVVKNLGPQLSRLPGLAGMTVLASGAVALIYNPVALATVYGAQARAMSFDPAQPHALESQAQIGTLDARIADVQPRELSGDAAPVVPLVPANPASISAPTIPLVLVVDDSITVRRVTQRLLQREGYRVAMAADGLQALERLAEELPSVILSDIEMPRMDGFDFLRNVRGSAEYKHLPTIMITSRIAEKHREHAFELGANHYLGKPYNEEELLSLIRRYAREEATI